MQIFFRTPNWKLSKACVISTLILTRKVILGILIARKEEELPDFIGQFCNKKMRERYED